MSTKSVSPTATLLRSSRLFSLPPPLRRPGHDFLTSAALTRQSETATLPYPTHQALATPQSSLSRGDWGLKRPLPLKSTTKSGRPSFRIHAIDTIEHITEYESAGDYNLTLRKWQEMNLPLSVNRKRQSASKHYAEPSVFEKDVDNTAQAAAEADDKTERWKYRGPWIAGMTEAEFRDYLKKVRKLKGDFREYVREFVRARETVERRRELQAEGRDVSEVDRNPIEVDDRLLDDEIKRMRDSTTLDSTLSTLIQRYLDLPALMNQNSTGYTVNPMFQRMVEDQIGTAEMGPPTTHPSAGLSYLRTRSYLENHPFFGPQKEHTPVQARVLQPRHMGQGETWAKFGVGGVVTDSRGDSRFNNTRTTGTANLDVDTPGGAKVWISPGSATINSAGKIVLEVKLADPMAVGVHTGQTDNVALTNSYASVRLPPVAALSTGSRKTSFGLDYGLTNRPNRAQMEEKRSEDREYEQKVRILTRVQTFEQAQQGEL